MFIFTGNLLQVYLPFINLPFQVSKMGTERIKTDYMYLVFSGELASSLVVPGNGLDKSANEPRCCYVILRFSCIENSRSNKLYMTINDVTLETRKISLEVTFIVFNVWIIFVIAKNIIARLHQRRSFTSG